MIYGPSWEFHYKFSFEVSKVETWIIVRGNLVEHLVQFSKLGSVDFHIYNPRNSRFLNVSSNSSSWHYHYNVFF